MQKTKKQLFYGVYFLATVNIILLLVPSCDEIVIKLNSDQPPAGIYIYIGMDSLKTNIIQGTISLNYEDSITIEGNWNFNSIGNPQQIGPQIGGGKLDGGYENGTTWIRLNPNMIDNNVELRGTYKNDVFTGTWTYIGFQGVINQGYYTAKKR